MLDTILDTFEHMVLNINNLSKIHLELSSKNTRNFDTIVSNALNILNHIKYARTRDHDYIFS